MLFAICYWLFAEGMSDLDLIKQKLDIVQFISEYVPLKKAGRNFTGLCPFHSEKTPSFVVSPDRQIWHCFGACQTGGDIAGFLMRIENLEFPEALRTLAKRAGVALKTYESTETSRLRDKILEINHLAAEYYHYILTSHLVGEPAREYLTDRQISEGSLKLFKIGYAPRAWDSLIKYLTKKGYTTPDLNIAGLVSLSDKGHAFDRFRGRVIFTLFDHRDNVVGFAGRLLDPEAKEAKYINTAETPVYTKGNVLYGLNVTREAIKAAGSAVVVEGEIDAIQSFQAGIKNVVAIKGSALTEGQVSLLKRYTENIILSLDADFAGDSAARRGIETADKAGLSIKVVRLLYGKDPDDCVKKDPGLWQKSVDSAVPFYDFIIDSALSRFDKTTADGKGKIVSAAAKYLVAVENMIVKDHYVKRLSALLAISEEAINAEMEREARKASLGTGPETVAASPDMVGTSRAQSVEEYLLALLLQCCCPWDHVVLIKKRLLPADFASPARGRIYELLLATDEAYKAADFIKNLPPELMELADKLYLLNVGDIPDDPVKAGAEISLAAWEVRELSLREKLRQISLEIKAQGLAEEKKLETEFDTISRELQTLLRSRALVTEGSLALKQ